MWAKQAFYRLIDHIWGCIERRYFMRGEGTITLENGKEQGIILNNRALANAQANMGMGILEVVRRFQESELGVVELAHLVHAGAAAHRRENGGKPLDINAVYDLIDAAGFTHVATVIMECISEVLSYDSREAGQGEEIPND